MPWLFLVAAAAGIALYLKERAAKAPASAHKTKATAAQLATGQHANPLSNVADQFYGEGQRITRAFSQDTQEAGAVAAQAQQAAGVAQGVAGALAGLAATLKTMPGLFKDMGLDNTGSAKQTPGGLTASMFRDPGANANAAQSAETLDFGQGSPSLSGAFGGNFGTAGADPQATGDTSVLDFGVDTSSVDSVYPNSLFPIASGTAGTVSDGVSPDPTFDYNPWSPEYAQTMPETILAPPPSDGFEIDSPGVDTIGTGPEDLWQE